MQSRNHTKREKMQKKSTGFLYFADALAGTTRRKKNGSGLLGVGALHGSRYT